MVSTRDNCFAIKPFPEPAVRNAGFTRQNRGVRRALPDKSGVPRARWFMATRRDKLFGVETPYENQNSPCI
jgi:hypothetical protein